MLSLKGNWMRSHINLSIIFLALLVLTLSSKNLYAQPENSFQIGGTWYCNNDYKRSGDKCIKISVPANAWVQGSLWYCNNGYKRSGNECIKFKVPANAWVQGSQWYCNNGYRRSGEQCIKMDIPANAYAYGSQWHCNIDFKKVGRSCKEMTPIEKQQQLKALAAQGARAKNQNVEGFDFSLRDIERKCEAYKYSDSYGDIECSGSNLREVERRCEAYFSDSQNGEMECNGSLRSISGDCSINMYSDNYGELDC